MYKTLTALAISKQVSTVRNIPKFKDRANWSRDTFQTMRRRARALVFYQQTNKKKLCMPHEKSLKYA